VAVGKPTTTTGLPLRGDRRRRSRHPPGRGDRDGHRLRPGDLVDPVTARSGGRSARLRSGARNRIAAVPRLISKDRCAFAATSGA